MQLILITPDHTKSIAEETAIVNDCFAAGLQKLHLRKPSFTENNYREYLQQIKAEYCRRIVLTDYFELGATYKTGGVHLNSHIRTDAALWAQIKELNPGTVAASFHSWDELSACKKSFDYIFISPVFDSISKHGYKAAVQLNGAKEIKEQFHAGGRSVPGIIGLGGVAQHNIQLLEKNGFDGGALLGAVWQAKDPVAAFVAIKNAVNFFAKA